MAKSTIQILSVDDQTTHATYVYGPYIDDVLTMRRGGQDYYYHADDLFNVVKVSNASGVVVEKYDYSDYGMSLIFTPGEEDDTLLPQSAIGNPYLWNGRNWDAETGFYYYRTRYLDPVAGRFTTRDSIGLWGDLAHRGNAMSYLGNNPQTFLDPVGTRLRNEHNYPVIIVDGTFPGGTDIPLWPGGTYEGDNDGVYIWDGTTYVFYPTPGGIGSNWVVGPDGKLYEEGEEGDQHNAPPKPYNPKLDDREPTFRDKKYKFYDPRLENHGPHRCPNWRSGGRRGHNDPPPPPITITPKPRRNWEIYEMHL